jgi:hypothetical protein
MSMRATLADGLDAFTGRTGRTHSNLHAARRVFLEAVKTCNNPLEIILGDFWCRRQAWAA